jgi:hypothetical protein
MLLREIESLRQILDLLHALHAAAPARIHRLDDEIAAALDGDALKHLRRRNGGEPRDRHAGGQEPLLHRQLVASQPRAFLGNASEAEAFVHGGHGHRRIGRDADHAIDLPQLARIALGSGGGFLRRVDIRDDAGIGIFKSGRIRIAIGYDNIKTHFLGALGGVRRFNAAGNDEKRLIF